MLKCYGTLYANNKEELNEILAVLEHEGFQLAYTNNAGGNIVKEVPDQEENNQNGDSND